MLLITKIRKYQISEPHLLKVGVSIGDLSKLQPTKLFPPSRKDTYVNKEKIKYSKETCRCSKM